MGAWFAAVSSDAANTPGIMVNTIRRQRRPARSFFFMVFVSFQFEFLLMNGRFRGVFLVGFPKFSKYNLFDV
jgi:hypothetical protein